ncbi:MAG: hypothetical protein C4527_20030 [Candidatus Omnitrophota bacterium]|jgi:hypothetical protein|nr:MAG: hypothetical protein C4527_20030 [Candidatus Omnitrophota bacterium]
MCAIADRKTDSCVRPAEPSGNRTAISEKWDDDIPFPEKANTSVIDSVYQPLRIHVGLVQVKTGA